jgi:hypothetical protein
MLNPLAEKLATHSLREQIPEFDCRYFSDCIASYCEARSLSGSPSPRFQGDLMLDIFQNVGTKGGNAVSPKPKTGVNNRCRLDKFLVTGLMRPLTAPRA